MSGSQMFDALTPNLLSGMTLDADGTIEGTAVQVNAPGQVRFLLTLPNTANDAEIQVQIQGCETSDFSTSDVRNFGGYPNVTDAAAQTAAAQLPFEYDTYIDSTYIRAHVIMLDGTNGDFVGATLYMVPEHYHRIWPRGDSIGNVDQGSAAPLA